MKISKLTLLGIILSLTLATTTLALPNGAGPAEKATGEVWTTNPVGKVHHFWFNAHKEMGNRPAKGYAALRNYLQGETEVNRAIDIEVDTVEVDGNTAYFSGLVVYDNFNQRLGDRLYFYVEDNGTPGREGDMIQWGWTVGPPLSFTGQIYEGNLVTHTYE